ncbi:MAG: nitrous oxide-stimulated promoter family protein [Bacteroidota bacterium]|nr:nitrous oxide-stimulated promoter family protein [Bacteroidota bacterium]
MNKIERDKQTIRFMVRLYCKHHLHELEPSEDYQQLIDYSCQRLNHCPFGEQKPACKRCKVHCYKPDMRRRMREVMRWTGPRMLFYSPRATLRHLIQSLKRSPKR